MRKKRILSVVVLVSALGLLIGGVAVANRKSKVTEEGKVVGAESGNAGAVAKTPQAGEKGGQPPEQQEETVREANGGATEAGTEENKGEVPLIFIETENKAGVTDDKSYTNCTVSVTNCEAAYELEQAAAGIRLRGNSTQMYEKKPYRLRFEEKQQLLGLSEGADRSWVLLAEFNDASLLRNLITYRFAKELEGISYTTDCRLVEVYLDGEYIGLYLLAEQTKVGKERINLDESGVADATVTDTGYLLELEADRTRRSEEGAEGEAWFAVTGYANEKDNSMQMPMERTFDETSAFYVIKSDARSKEQVAYIQNYMIQVYDAIYREKSKEAVGALVDLASAVDMYLVQLIANDFDNNYSSVYVYKDAGGKLMFGAPWDFDLAYGNFTGYTEAEDTVYIYHLLRQLGEYDWFREMLAERYLEISTGEDSPVERMKASITELTEAYAGAFEREYARWRDGLVSMGGFGGNEGFGNWGAWGNWGEWQLPEGTEGAEGFEGWENWGTWQPPENGEGEVGVPENGGFGAFGAWGDRGEWQLPEGTEGFENWGDWGNMEGFGNWGDWGNMEDFGNRGGFGGWNNFSYGATYDTHREAAEALLTWLNERLLWIEEFLCGDTE